MPRSIELLRAKQVFYPAPPTWIIAANRARFVQRDEHRTSRVCVGLHVWLLRPSAVVALCFQQLLDQRLHLSRRHLQFVREPQPEHLVFGVGSRRGGQPLLDGGCAGGDLLLLFVRAKSIQAAKVLASAGGRLRRGFQCPNSIW